MEKQKRFYKVNEMVWSINLKKEVKVKSINIEDKTIVVTEKKGKEIIEHTFNLWEVDKLKFKAKEKSQSKKGKITYFSSVEGGIIPTKEEENGGYDCYARLEPSEVNEGGEVKIVHELFLPKMQLTKIPLGFASYLPKDNVLSLTHERSSVGQLGLLNVSGLIDSTYQGEVILMVIPLLHNILITDQVDKIYYDEKNDLILYPSTKAITQAVILQLSKAKSVHIPYNELLNKPSIRGKSGWGSTSK